MSAAMPGAALAQSQAKTPAAPARPYVTDTPVVMIKDTGSGEVLFARGADKRFAPASMVKVMTAYVVLDMVKRGELARDRRITVSEEIWKTWSARPRASKMFLRAGERVSVDDLLKGLITVSGNDAASALAVGIDGSESVFVKRMNDVAARLGMTSSRFGTASGWPDGGVTKVSADDMLLLAERLIRDHPADYARYFGMPQFQHGLSPDGKPIVQTNRNPILGRVTGADGLKTGYTAEAGYCLLGSAKRDGRRLVVIIAGLPSEKARREEAERLFRWGFSIPATPRGRSAAK